MQVWLLPCLDYTNTRQSSVFDDLAHRIVHSTTVSLTHAAALLSKSASPTDSALFLVSHLLLLKQQIVAFDIEFVTPETEVQYNMSSISTTFWELRSRGGLFNPRNLVGLLIPKVVENMLDAKDEVDARLRQAINEFTSQFIGRMTSPIDVAKGKQAPIAEAPARTAKVRQNIETETPFLRTKLEEYISDRRTREMLVQAVLEAVTQRYEEWFDALGRSGKGKGREDGVGDPDAFGDWCRGVFRVGMLEESGSEEASESEDESMDGTDGGGGGGLRIKM
jgi:hypothetical protein